VLACAGMCCRVVWLGTLYSLVGGSVVQWKAAQELTARIGGYRFGLRKCVVPAGLNAEKEPRVETSTKQAGR
jgi:hypothetical protein